MCAREHETSPKERLRIYFVTQLLTRTIYGTGEHRAVLPKLRTQRVSPDATPLKRFVPLICPFCGLLRKRAVREWAVMYRFRQT